MLLCIRKDKASLLEAESFAAQRVQLSDELQELRAKCVEVIEELAEKNPTAQPTIGWRRAFQMAKPGFVSDAVLLGQGLGRGIGVADQVAG